MNYQKGIVSELGYDPKKCSTLETDKILAAFELETIFICNGWKINHKSRLGYEASRTVKDQKGQLQRQNVTVSFNVVRVYVDSNIPLLEQILEKFKYYEWFSR